jgi:hypothetical protein
MKIKRTVVLALPALTLIAASLQAAEPAATPKPAEPAATAAPAETAPAADTPSTDAAAAEGEAAAEETTTWAVAITPRLFFFDYFDGVGEDQTQFLERYDVREDFSGDRRNGWYADIDLDIVGNDGDRDFFVLERRGFGEHNHRGFAKYANEKLNVYGGYNDYRSMTGGIDYLFNPNLVPGGTTGGNGIAGTFNDDSGTSLYHIDRTTYNAGLKLKPGLLGGWGTVSVDY